MPATPVQRSTARPTMRYNVRGFAIQGASVRSRATIRTLHHIARHATTTLAQGHDASAARAIFIWPGRFTAIVFRLTENAQPRIGKDLQPLARDRPAAAFAFTGHSPVFVIVVLCVAGRQPHGAALGTRKPRGRDAKQFLQQLRLGRRVAACHLDPAQPIEHLRGTAEGLPVTLRANELHRQSQSRVLDDLSMAMISNNWRSRTGVIILLVGKLRQIAARHDSPELHE